MKTVKDIDTWFNAECRQALNEIPQGIKDMARKSREYTIIIAESIARKKGFRKNAVLKYLDSLI
jgi:hypothetical protein